MKIPLSFQSWHNKTHDTKREINWTLNIYTTNTRRYRPPLISFCVPWFFSANQFQTNKCLLFIKNRPGSIYSCNNNEAKIKLFNWHLVEVLPIFPVANVTGRCERRGNQFEKSLTKLFSFQLYLFHFNCTSINRKTQSFNAIVSSHTGDINLSGLNGNIK